MPPSPNARRSSQLPPYRAVFAVDTKDFSLSPSAHQERLSRDIPQLLERALEQCGLSRLWQTKVFASSTGDGYYFGVDAMDTPFLVDPFLDELNEVLDEHDEVVRARDRALKLRLRASVHLGPVPESGLSTSMNETHRLLDAEPVRRILTASDADVTYVAAILSQRVFTDVVRGGYVKKRASQFAANAVKVKNFEDHAYLYTPKHSVNPELLDGVDAARVDRERLEQDQRRAVEPEPQRGVVVHNNFSGTTSGSVLQIGQARDINGLNGGA
ncbi:hypothetical protein [Saccharopolyspora gregorii]|uniref:Uncharacterized protein n=1 Tax=Saccharopolyspora gregorii TaxID=33914 RepID=A0ABP6RX97_9PSEU|nr:hypothetical protein [Saccharopolyspora gregorii]